MSTSVALVGALLAATLATVVAASPARAALAAPYTGAFLDGAYGEDVTAGRHLTLPNVTVLAASASAATLEVSDGTERYTLEFAAASGQPLVVGTYEGAVEPANATTEPGFSVRGAAPVCGPTTGRFVVDELTRDGGGGLRTFSARFEQTCVPPTSLIGAVSFQATADFRDRTIDRNLLDFGSGVYQGQTSDPQRITVTNLGPAPLHVTAIVRGQPQADEFHTTDTCVGASLAVGQSCTIDVVMTPTSSGLKLVRLAIVDDVAPLGRGVMLTGRALDGSPPLKALGEFTPLVPARVLDTRIGLGRPGGEAGAGETFSVAIGGHGGVPATGVLAVALNVTVTGPTEASYLTIWPEGVPRPLISNLNFVGGQTVPNLVTVAAGPGGRLSVYNHQGSTDVVIDVVGWYATDDGQRGSQFVPFFEPARVIDTRVGVGSPARPLGPAGTLPARLAPFRGIPIEATAVVLNVTATNPTESGYLTVSPADAPRPIASNLNFVAGQTVANLVIVRLSAEGRVNLFNSAGTTHVVADVVGWYGVSNGSGYFGRLRTGVPQRLFDSRVASPFPGSGALRPNSVLVSGAVTGVQAFVYNVTAVAPTAGGYLTVYPGGNPIPDTSSLNFAPGITVANHVIVGNGRDGHVGFYNSAGETHLIVDLFAVFA